MSLENVMKEKLALSVFNTTLKTEYSFIKPKQLECLRAVYDNDVITVLPTGYGKSLIFEMLPYFTKYVTGKSSIVILIAPLNAIINQELSKLGSSSVHVRGDVAISSTSNKARYYIGHSEDVLSQIDDLILKSLKVDVTYVVVDEAHCILDWGEDFRPEFRHIEDLRSHISNIRMLAVTATASHSSKKAIAFSLGMREFQQISSLPAINANVLLSVCERTPSVGGNYTVEEAYNYVFKPLLLELNQLGQSFPLTIVYCKLQWCSYGVHLARRLLGQNIDLSVIQYHAQQPEELNHKIIEHLSKEECDIKLVFATIALGMGCDLRNVKRVYHAGPPSTIEEYSQEVGRAGRDGSGSNACLYFNATDVANDHVEISMKEFCKNKTICRREFLSSYFNSVISKPQYACCDICEEIESIRGKEFKMPTLQQRQQLIESIEIYQSADDTNVLDKHIIKFIGDTFEYVHSIDEFESFYHLPKVVAEAIFTIKTHVFEYKVHLNKMNKSIIHKHYCKMGRG